MIVLVSWGLVGVDGVLLLPPRCCGIDAVRLGRVRKEVVTRVAIWRGAVKRRVGLEDRVGEGEMRRGIMVL